MKFVNFRWYNLIYLSSYIILIFSLMFNFLVTSGQDPRNIREDFNFFNNDKQYINQISDKKIDTQHAVVTLEYPFNKNYLNLEKYTVYFSPFSIKMVYLPLNKVKEVRFVDVMVMKNFDILFESKKLTIDTFTAPDTYRTKRMITILELIRLKYASINNYCRFLLTKTSNKSQMFNSLFKLEINLNIFCFESFENVVYFNINLMKHYNKFVKLNHAISLSYYNPILLNYLKIKFQKKIINRRNIYNEEEDKAIQLQGRYEYGYIIYNDNGVVLTTNPNFLAINAAMMTFNYENIRDCKIVPLPNAFEGKSRNLKCCIGISVDMKDAFDNKFEICSNRVTPYKCNLEAKFLREMITSKCYNHFNKSFDFIFHNLKNPRDFVMSYVTYNINFVYSRILDYMLNITKMNIFTNNQKISLEDKLQNIIQSLGKDFQDFLRLNNVNNIIAEILAKSESNLHGEHIVHYPNDMYSRHFSSDHTSPDSKFNDFLFQQDNINSKQDISFNPLLSGFDNGHHDTSRYSPIPFTNSNFEPRELRDTVHEHIILPKNPSIEVDNYNGFTPQKLGYVPNDLLSDQNNPQPGECLSEEQIHLAGSEESGIFKTCENHPKMKECICAGYPASDICKKSYCINHPNFYECSPIYCNKHSDDLEACKCKYEPFSLECKCRLNPHLRECFCLKYSESLYCRPDFCKKNDNKQEVFCLCKKNPNAPECNPSYCFDNKFDKRCICLNNPYHKDCECIMKPNSEDCDDDRDNEENCLSKDKKGKGTKMKEGNSRKKKFRGRKDKIRKIKDLYMRKKDQDEPGCDDEDESKEVVHEIKGDFNEEKDEHSNKDKEKEGEPDKINHVNKNEKKILKSNDDEKFPRRDDLSGKDNDNDKYSNRNHNFLPRNHTQKNQKDDEDPLKNKINDSSSSDDQTSCNPNDIFCLCKNHPKYKDCVCLAYPKSVICSEDYCLDNKDNYECNPSKCDSDEKKSSDVCYCKENYNDTKCKCKLNPFQKECFCVKYPSSHLCNKKNCKLNPNTVFCKCDARPKSKICSPTFCNDSPKSVHCKCILEPLSNECKCINDPYTCTKKDIMKAVVQYDIEIRHMCKRTLNYFEEVKQKNENLRRKFRKKRTFDSASDDVLTNYYFDVDPKLIAGIYFPNCPGRNRLVVTPIDYPIGIYDLCLPFPKPEGECIIDGEIYTNENTSNENFDSNAVDQNNDRKDKKENIENGNNQNYNNIKNSTTAISFLQHKSHSKPENPVILLYRKQLLVNSP